MLEKQSVKDNKLKLFNEELKKASKLMISLLAFFILVYVTLVTSLFLQAIQVRFSVLAAQLTFVFNDVD